jgi:hypothetical protein
VEGVQKQDELRSHRRLLRERHIRLSQRLETSLDVFLVKRIGGREKRRERRYLVLEMGDLIGGV